MDIGREKGIETYDDDDFEKNFGKYITKWRDDLPYNRKRYIMIIGFTILVMLVVYLGYAYGGLKVCSQLDGILDSNFTCHPYYNPTSELDAVGMPFVIPNISIQSK